MVQTGSTGEDAQAIAAAATRVPVLIGLNGACSVATTFLNKAVTGVFTSPLQVIAVQNGVGVLATAVFLGRATDAYRPFSTRQAVVVLPTLVLFILLLWTSLQALAVTSVSTTVVTRSFLPACVAVWEAAILGTYLSASAYVPLGTMVASSLLYLVFDQSLNGTAVAYLAANTLCASLLSVLERRVTIVLKDEQTPMGIALLRNAISVPSVLAVLLLFSDNGAVSFSVADVTGTQLFMLLASAITATLLSLSYFQLQKETVATVIAVAGCATRILTVLIDLVFFRPNTITPAFVGMLLLYSLSIVWFTVARLGDGGSSAKEPAGLRRVLSLFAALVFIVTLFLVASAPPAGHAALSTSAANASTAS